MSTTTVVNAAGDRDARPLHHAVTGVDRGGSSNRSPDVPDPVTGEVVARLGFRRNV